jgi:hypothetical protein
MTAQDARSFSDITETVRGAIHRLYATSPPKDAAHVAQHHAMALGMIIVWADLSFDMNCVGSKRLQIQVELETDVAKLDLQALQRLSMPY